MKKNKTKLQQKWNTTQSQLTIRFMSLLIGMALLLSMLIIGITISALYESTEEQAELLEQSLEDSQANDKETWQKALTTYVSDDSPYYVRMVLPSGELLYSHDGAEEYTDFTQWKQLVLLNKIVWNTGGDPYYYKNVQINQTNITILVDMEDTLEVIYQIVSFTFLLTLLVIVIGSLITSRFSKNLSQSLQTMNIEIQTIGLDVEEEKQLTEPVSPQEVKNISHSFNLLLEKQRATLRREKQFVTDASHELRTPLSAIRGHVNLIKRRGTEHPEVIPKSLTFIDKESKRMELLVTQLLSLGSQYQTESFQYLNFTEIIERVLEDLEVLMSQSLEVNMEKNVLIWGNQESFIQIVRNLVENAVKYTPETGAIKIELSATSDAVKLVVSDTGTGIPDEEKEHIFERFYRVDQSRSSEIAGSGIGLALVQELVTSYKGLIQVTDNQPKGTGFTIIFPKKVIE